MTDDGSLGLALNVALRATIAVPGLLPPVRRGGQVLMDDGIVDNVSISACRQLGAATVIAVRLHAKWERVRMMRMVSSAAEAQVTGERVRRRQGLGAPPHQNGGGSPS